MSTRQMILENPRLQYLATIEGCPLLWDDQMGGPWWPEGEPEDIRYESTGAIQIDAHYDVYRMPRWGQQPKTLACGHLVRGGECYLTQLVDQRDICLTCAGGHGA